MDVQTENTDPPPNEMKPSGKIRKGFKLFGKRKPGNIFSIRSKGDGNKSPVVRSKTSDRLSETAAPDCAQEVDKENEKEESQGQREQDETLCEDSVLASAAARTSISSASSAKSLGFLTLLRGGRRGVGDRRVHTVSQPVGRQRRGLKGLFSNVKLRSKDKEDKEEAPPSPLLMSSRASSVEIIKEDLTLTPKCQPRSLESGEIENGEPIKNSGAGSQSEISSSPLTSYMSTANELVPPLPTSEPPLEPGDTSLSSLLADISSLLTFDSISGGDIMADVEAEWGKASSVISADSTPGSTSPSSKQSISSRTTSTTATVKPSSIAVTTKPDTTITTSTKSSTLTSQAVTRGSESYCNFQAKPALTSTSTKPSTVIATYTTFSAPVTSVLRTVDSSSRSIVATSTDASTISSASTPSSAPSNTSTATKLTTEIALQSQNTAPVSTPCPMSVTTAAPPKMSVISQDPPVPLTHSIKLDPVSSLSLEKSTYKPSQSFSAAEPKDKDIFPPTCTSNSSFPASVISSKPGSGAAPSSGSSSTALSKSVLIPNHVDVNKTVSDPGPSSTITSSIKTQPSSASFSVLTSNSLDTVSSATKSSTAAASLGKMTSPMTPSLAGTTATMPPTSSVSDQIKVYEPKEFPAQMPNSVPKDLKMPDQTDSHRFKASSGPNQVQVSGSKDPTAPVTVSSSSVPMPISACMQPALLHQVLVSKSKDSSVPISSSEAAPAPAVLPVSQHKTQNTLASPTTSPLSPPASMPSDTCVSGKTKVPEQTSVSHQLPSQHGAPGQGNQELPSKQKDPTSESHMHQQKKPTQAKATGLSKIPVVGGGRGAKIPVRESHHGSDEPSREPPTPEQEEKPHFNSHDAGVKGRINSNEATSPTSKHGQEEFVPPQPPKALTKIPVKHGTQAPNKEPARTKIPVSKVPVRRAATKPGGGTQMRK